ncbi:hypothetical protein EV643_104124 [Kribbella sp. VKM Ac-2527]|uniref:Uncharacterized protein n=1 Tax=Kribbella caucasensis TaxID=2512215 RepID=A0A4R6KKG7_9ACTN|nr:hypothetical protein [Kribbella sp. VKM Ac-2527]TDO50631.1 hypothetical protein EV643_104124 [Kribbella sp. VKM Ac-2527]
MSQMYLKPDYIPMFEGGAQYPPFAHAEPTYTTSGMPGVGLFNQAVLAAVTRGKDFDNKASTGVESLKVITRRCGAEYSQNDTAEATNIARTAATKGDQVRIIDDANRYRLDYPMPSGV